MTTVTAPVSLAPTVRDRLAALRAERDAKDEACRVEQRLKAVRRFERFRDNVLTAISPELRESVVLAHTVPDDEEYWLHNSYPIITIHVAGLAPIVAEPNPYRASGVHFLVAGGPLGRTVCRTFDDALLAAAEVAGVQG